MNKSAIVLKVIILVAILFGTTVVKSQNSDELVRVYRQALELNEGRFDDPNLIYIGDTVLFPSRTGNGVEAWIADEPSEGQHDSFWRLSEKYLAGEIETVPADTMQITINTPVQVDEPVKVDEDEKSSNFFSWWWIIFIILIVAILLYAAISHYKTLRNPDNYEPVGGDIDVMNREQSLDFVFTNYLKPGERIVSFRTGALKNSNKKKRLTVEMRFGDSKVRTVEIPTGERVTEAIVENEKGDRRILYLRNACANGFSNGQFAHLPAGWYIKYSETEEEGRIQMEESESGTRFIIKRPVATEDVSSKSSKNNLNALVEVIKALNVKGSNIDISFNEKPDELNLSLKVNRKKKGKKKSRKA